MKSEINSTIPLAVKQLHGAIVDAANEGKMPEHFYLGLATIDKDGSKDLHEISMSKLPGEFKLLALLNDSASQQMVLMALAAAITKVDEAVEVVLFGEATVGTYNEDHELTPAEESKSVRRLFFTYQNQEGDNRSFYSVIAPDGKSIGEVVVDESPATTIMGDRTLFTLAEEADRKAGIPADPSAN